MRSSAFTVALSYVALGIIALILLAAPLWYAWRVTVENGRAEVLQVDAQRLSEVFNKTGQTGLTSYINARVNMQIANERTLMFADPELNKLAGNLPNWPASVPSSPGVHTSIIMVDGHDTEMMVVRVSLPGGYNLLVARDSSRFNPLATYFWYGFAGAVGVLVIFGLLGAVLVRRAVLTRVNDIGQTTAAIMQGNLSRRLALSSNGDELNTLSSTINGMLDQIEQLVHGIRDVSNAIAHDLRTPLAELRSRLEELTLVRPSPTETFQEIDSAVNDVDRVIGIFNALLRLAEIDTGAKRSGFIQVDLLKIAQEVFDFYLPAAESKELLMSFHGHGLTQLQGDPFLIAQAIGNVLDNAIKYCPASGAISMKVYQSEELINVDVTDSGLGVPEDEIPRLTERFYRGDSSRGSPGVGLGLSLVAAVCRLHGGALNFLNLGPGLTVSITFKK